MKKFIYILFLIVFAFSSCTQEDDVSESILGKELSKPISDKKITICHKGEETISVSKNALQAHLDHGDKIGPCGYTYIPDDNFEKALFDYDDIEGDNLVPTANIELESTLTINAKDIFDLTGIEDFLSLTFLDCSDNQLTSLNLSLNTALRRLRCGKNNLTSLDVSQNTNLVSLRCAVNKITELDVGFNTGLTDLRCNSNLLTKLNLSKNKDLIFLFCQDQEDKFACIEKGDNPLSSLSSISNTGGVPILENCGY